MTEFYVYVLEREDGTPFYVGKGTGDRVRKHAQEARRRAGINPHKERIIRKMLAVGLELPYRIDSVHEIEADAHAREVALITEIGRHNLGTGPLTNLTAGGDGIVGNKLTDAQKAACSAYQKARYADPALREWARRNLARQRLDPAFAEALARHRTSEAFQAARRAAHAAKLADPEHLADVAEAARQQWQDPAYRATHTERNRQMARDPSNRAVNAAAARERWAAGTYDGCKKGVVVEGKAYGSMSEAAAALGTSVNTLSARFRRYAKKGSFPEGFSYLFDQVAAAA